MSAYHFDVLYLIYMDGKQAMTIQYQALRTLVPEEDWRVDSEVMEKLGKDFRYTIDTHPGEVTKDVLIHCWGSNNGRDPRDRVAEIVCEVLAAQDDKNI